MIDIYRKVGIDKALEEKLDDIEKALGFKLFVWQRTFIENGVFRQYGETTARILRELIDTEKAVDFSKAPVDRRQDFYRKELLKIKQELDEAGIKTAPVARNREELRKLERKMYERKLSIYANNDANNDYKRPGSGSVGR